MLKHEENGCSDDITVPFKMLLINRMLLGCKYTSRSFNSWSIILLSTDICFENKLKGETNNCAVLQETIVSVIITCEQMPDYAFMLRIRMDTACTMRLFSNKSLWSFIQIYICIISSYASSHNEWIQI